MWYWPVSCRAIAVLTARAVLTGRGWHPSKRRRGISCPLDPAAVPVFRPWPRSAGRSRLFDRRPRQVLRCRCGDGHGNACLLAVAALSPSQLCGLVASWGVRLVAILTRASGNLILILRCAHISFQEFRSTNNDPAEVESLENCADPGVKFRSLPLSATSPDSLDSRVRRAGTFASAKMFAFSEP